jgi:hypothetical protein
VNDETLTFRPRQAPREPACSILPQTGVPSTRAGRTRQYRNIRMHGQKDPRYRRRVWADLQRDQRHSVLPAQGRGDLVTLSAYPLVVGRQNVVRPSSPARYLSLMLDCFQFLCPLCCNGTRKNAALSSADHEGDGSRLRAKAPHPVSSGERVRIPSGPPARSCALAPPPGARYPIGCHLGGAAIEAGSSRETCAAIGNGVVTPSCGGPFLSSDRPGIAADGLKSPD